MNSASASAVLLVTLAGMFTLLVMACVFGGTDFLRAAYRRSQGRCALCGYDLYANLTGVCPECGESAPVRA